MLDICNGLKLESERAIVAAVSGGSDSIALLVLLQDYLHDLSQRQSVPRLVAVTVDHDLRTESAAEAQAVAHFCAERNIQHVTKIWNGQKPVTGISVAARQMRYQLLMEAAAEVGAEIIFTGHSQDDQVETFIMRQARDGQADTEKKAFMRGLAGMADFTLLSGSYLLVRPLLNARREQLRDQLRERGIGWIDDPTNVDTHYERPRIRQTRKESEHGFYLDLRARAAADRVSLNERVVNYWDENPKLLQSRAPDIALVDQHLLAEMPKDEAAVFIGFVLALTGGKNRLLRGEDRFLILHKMLDGRAQHKRMNYAGCIIELKAGQYRIWREQRNLPIMPITMMEKRLWDQRYIIENKSAEEVEIRPVNRQDFYAFCTEYDLNRSIFFHPAVFSSPGIYIQNQLAALPALGLAGLQTHEIASRKHYPLLDNVLTGHDFILAERFYRHFNGEEFNPVANICRKFHKNRL